MQYEIFENDKEKGKATAALTGFTDLPGWKLIEKAIDLNVKYFEDQLKDRIEKKRDFDSLLEIYAIQDRIDDLKSLKDLPTQIFLAAQPEPIEEEDEDIY